MALKKLKWLKYLFIGRLEGETEQQYWNEKRKKHLAGEHSEGVVNGLAVTETAPTSLSVEIAAGRALDTDGNDPEVESVQEIDCAALVPPSGEATAYITLRFSTVESDPYFVDEIGASQNKYVQDSFALEASTVPPTAPTLELARFRLGAGATQILDAADPSNPGLNEIDLRFVKRSGKEVLALRDLVDVDGNEADAFNAMPAPSAVNRIAVLGDIAPLSAEVQAARGTKPSLDERLDVSLNEDGTLKPAAAFGGAIDRHEIDMLRPVPQAAPDATLKVKAGLYTKTNGGGFIDLPETSTSAFSPVSGGGLVRYDLVQLTDAGAIEILTGAEVATPGDPIADSPVPANDKLAVAIVRVTETAGVVIDTADITDVREFFSKGNTGGGGTGPARATFEATAGQTVFDLPFSYEVADDRLLVYSGGLYMSQGAGLDYLETNPTRITFNSGREAGEVITVVKRR